MNRFLIAVYISFDLALAGCGRSNHVSTTPSVDAPQKVTRADAESDSPLPPETAADPNTTSSTKAVEIKEITTGPTDTAPPAVDDPTRQLVAEMSDHNPQLRSRAVQQLIESIGDPKNILVILLFDKDVEVRRGAAFGLMDRFDPSDETIAEAAAKALSDEDRSVRQLAVQIVSQLNDELIETIVPQLAQLVEGDTEDLGIRIRATRLVGRLRTSGRAALSALIQVIRHESPRNLRTAAIDAAVKVTDNPSEIISVLNELLASNDDAFLRRVAADRLGQFGSQASVAVANLVQAMRDPEPRVRQSAANALGQIGPAALPHLEPLLDSDSREIRMRAIYSIGRMGAAAKSMVPRMEALRSDPDKGVAQVAAVALLRLQGE